MTEEEMASRASRAASRDHSLPATSVEPSGAWTPGPWEAEASGVSLYGLGAPVVRSGPGSHVAYLTRGLPGDGWPDAHLIAAAPDLAEALEELLGMAELFVPTPLDAPGFRRARAALNKARGL